MKHKLAFLGATISNFLTAGYVLAQSAGKIGVVQPEHVAVNNLGFFVSQIISIIFIIAAVLVFVYLVWGGIQWMTSGGDKQATQAARDRISAALVGLAIVALSWALIQIIGKFFGLESIFTKEGVPIPRGFEAPTPTVSGRYNL